MLETWRDIKFMKKRGKTMNRFLEVMDIVLLQIKHKYYIDKNIDYLEINCYDKFVSAIYCNFIL